MPRARSNGATTKGRVELIEVVKTPLGFFVLVVLIVEAVLGAVAIGGAGEPQRIALVGALALIAALVVVVALLAAFRPDALRGAVDNAGPIHKFCQGIAGEWWEVLMPADPSALSAVEVVTDEDKLSVRLRGRAYGVDGALVDVWESIAAAVNAADRKVYYQWKGRRLAQPDNQYEGFGEMTFYEDLSKGEGAFFDTNVTEWPRVRRKSTLLMRADEEDVRCLHRGEARTIAALVCKRLADVSGAQPPPPQAERRA